MNKTNQINQINSFRLSRTFCLSRPQTTRTAEYHSRPHDARRFPFDEDDGGTSEKLAAEGDIEHHCKSHSNAPKTRQPLDRKKDRTPNVQRPQYRKAHDYPDQHHPDDRAKPEHHDIRQPLQHRSRRRQHNQQQRRRPGQAMGHADTERSSGVTPPVYMSMIFDHRMTMQVHVPFTVMVVCMRMPAFSNQSHPKYPSEKHEHRADTELSRQRKGFRNRHAEYQHHRPDQQQHHCMSKSPAESNHAGSAERGSLRQHRRYGSQMIRVQGMAKPQHQPES